MRTLIIAFAALLATPTLAFADKFRCSGRTADGRTVAIYGSYAPGENLALGPVRLSTTERGVPDEYILTSNVRIKETADFFTLIASNSDIAVTIRHPQGTSGQTAITITGWWENEFERGSCEFM